MGVVYLGAWQKRGLCSTWPAARGQGEAALALVEAAAREGRWALLANCHLAPGCLLAVLAARLAAAPQHPGFRLWLTAARGAPLPAPLLHLCAKVAARPPQARAGRPAPERPGGCPTSAWGS